MARIKWTHRNLHRYYQTHRGGEDGVEEVTNEREGLPSDSMFTAEDRPVVDMGQAYEEVNQPFTTGESLDGSPAPAMSPTYSGPSLLQTGSNRLRSMMRFVSPMNLLFVLVVLVVWGFVLFEGWLFEGPQEYNTGPSVFKAQFDGQRRNDYTTVQPLEGTLTRNFIGSGLLCDILGIGCKSVGTGVLARGKQTPLYAQNVAAGGFNILKYQNVEPPKMTVGAAIGLDRCRGLSVEQARQFFVDRDITSHGWFKIATQTNDLCTTETDLLGCPQWRACITSIADRHFSTSKKPGFFPIKVAQGRWLKLPTDL